ncbi:MAG: cyclic nucleotide-binding domain-containing protein [Deltaproteobacteria bacterium]|nr:cyclic nucleotide-binding domain-containing protein [Deltaproteobacteria bacterium]
MASASGTAGPSPGGAAKSGSKPVQQFGRYEILDRIAVGGMAEILLARSASLGGIARTCVIKRVLPAYSSDLKFVTMFIDEARITIGLNHRNIVTLYEFGQHDGAYFMAMEYVDGTDLAELMAKLFARGESVDPRAAAYIARSMCHGLHYAHSKRDHAGQPLGIVHRDISPHNVLLSRKGEVKLTDFGIATARNKLSATMPGTVMGKSPYMSPEQAVGERVDARTDIWATGVILYEMLTGDRLFAAENLVATLVRVLNDPILRPSAKQPRVPPELDAIVLRALDRDIAHRYQTAEEMAADFDLLLGQEPYDASDLAAALAHLEWSGVTSPMRPSLSIQPAAAGPRSPTRPQPHLQIDDEQIRSLLASLRTEPSLWTLVALGDRYRALGQPEVARSAYRTAAAVFAFQGLLIAAVCALDPVPGLSGDPGQSSPGGDGEKAQDLMALADLEIGNRGELEALLQRFDGHGFWPLLQMVDPRDLGGELTGAVTQRARTPLFGFLAPREFTELARAVQVRAVAPGEIVIREGERSESLFAVGRGRLVVHCTPGSRDEVAALVATPGSERTETDADESTANDGRSPPTGERVYLAALADGDFFGEFSFFTRRPRSASVEAVTDCLLVEMERGVVDTVLDRDPTTSEPLLQFYKERVVELLMAKSPLLALFSPADRHELVRRSTLEQYRDSVQIVTQGERNDAFYFIKMGEVEVFSTDSNGLSIFVNKLRPGQFFGEIAALKNVPRTVSVRSMGLVTLLRISAADLNEMLDREPRVRGMFEQTIESRQAQLEERVDEHERIFYFT